MTPISLISGRPSVPHRTDHTNRCANDRFPHPRGTGATLFEERRCAVITMKLCC